MNVYKVVIVGNNSEFSAMAFKPANNPQLALNMAIRELPQHLWGLIDTVTVVAVAATEQPKIIPAPILR